MRFGLLVVLLMLQISAVQAACTGLYNHQFKTLQGKSFDLCEYQEHAILVVNTASKCGFTPQFEALEAMYETYQDQGLLVIGFPSNDFKQELKSDTKIGDFCKMTYGVKFPMMSKSSVAGKDANALYQGLIAKTGQAPMWNFYKYLILPKDDKVHVFSSTVKPDSDAILGRIKPTLKPE